jgi:hypothetical protein
MTIKVHNPVCHKCKQPARIYHMKKWWCHNDLNAEGYCPQNKRKEPSATNNN